MNAAGLALFDVWTAAAAHLWQSALVVLLILALTRRAHALSPRKIDFLWQLAWWKLVLPIGALWSLVDPGGTLARRILEGLGMSGSVASEITLLGGFAPVRTAGDAASSVSSAAAGGLALTALWAAGAAWCAWRFARDLRAAAAEARLEPARLPPHAERKVAEAAKRAGVPPARMLVTVAPCGPHVSGWLRPRLVLPLALVTRLAPADLDAVVHHEAAHLRRRDPLRNAVRRALGVPYFFFPFYRLVHRRLCESAEFLCDERVVRSGMDPRGYAQAIARTVRLGLSTPPLLASTGLAGPSHFRVRLTKLMEERSSTMSRLHVLLVSGALCAAFALAAIPVVLAGCAKESAAGDPSPDASIVVTEEPVPVRQVAPKYPAEAKEAGIEGKVIVKVLVGTDGRVSKTEILDGPEIFHAVSREAAVQWEFKPAELDGEPVAVWVAIPFRFQLEAKQ